MARRQLIKLRNDESALIIRRGGNIELLGNAHAHIMAPLASVLLVDNKKLAEDIQANYIKMLDDEQKRQSEPKELKDEVGPEND